MAGATLLTLLDDIASILENVSTMSQVAIKKTAGVLGDDLALNAKQVAGVSADRELPVVWRVAVGSAINKAILIPAALLISSLAPWAIKPLLMLGGIYLCFEGVEKLLHAWLYPHAKEEKARQKAEQLQALCDPDVDLVKVEKDKIRGAIRTDFILSAEIIVITLGTLDGKPFSTTLGVLLAIGILMTVGVYGLVAAIVKLDDLGLYWLTKKGNQGIDPVLRTLGSGILWVAPYLLRFLAIAGTLAMFLVGGGIIVHQFEFLHHIADSITETLHHIPLLGGLLAWCTPAVFDLLFGVFAGGLVVAVVQLTKWFFGQSSHPSPHGSNSVHE